MNYSFEIVRYDHGHGGHLYSIRIDNCNQLEIEKFLNDPLVRAAPEFSALEKRLTQMTHRHGYAYGFFKHNESKLSNTISALHYGSKSLRLYCYWTSRMIIVGSGGMKGKGAYQKYPACREAVRILEEVDKRFYARLRDQEISILRSGELKGNLLFRI